jgi:hypothetical protein
MKQVTPVPVPTIAAKLVMPRQEYLYDHIKYNAKWAKEMVQENSHKNRTVNICGAGPSLAPYVGGLDFAHETWGCNSALGYLFDHGAEVTHGFVIDQGEEMLTPREWGRALDVNYYIASCVHPKLTDHLLGQGRKLKWFHSYLGIPDPPDWNAKAKGKAYEMALYTNENLFPSGVQVGHGLNSVQRAICLALFMGFKKIRVYGADCACAPDAPPMPDYLTPEYSVWLDKLVAYADGTTALAAYGPQGSLAEAVIDGRRWHTRADMVISARHTVELMQTFPGRIELVGDTLPNATKDKDADFWSRMPSLTGVGTVSGFGVGRTNSMEAA